MAETTPLKKVEVDSRTVEEGAKKEEVQEEEAPAADAGDEKIKKKVVKKKKKSDRKSPATARRKVVAAPTPRRVAKQKHIEELRAKMRHVDWRDLTFVGTELNSIEGIRKDNFEFPALVKELTEGALSDLSKPVYLFMTSEPIAVPNDDGTAGTVAPVPVIIAYVCDVPPPRLVSHDSVQHQAARERALNPMGTQPFGMEQVNLDWMPYIPKHVEREVTDYLGKIKPPVYTLAWSGRAAQVRGMSEERLHYVEYINPFILLPQIGEACEKAEVNNVEFPFRFNNIKTTVVFDKEMGDRLKTFVPEFIETNKLDKDAAKPLEDAIRQAFKEAHAIADSEWTALQEQLQRQRDSGEADALRAMQLYKFYPCHPNYDVTPFMSQTVNRYYGKVPEANLRGGGRAEARKRRLAEFLSPPSKKQKSVTK
eukprot:TRINITY_DN9044_c0_g2_i1.p1 TRINITY_DN9044_c0_g2~~TRINITY_DN9044_c0_g2_i1.p1  ORF type:complete len:448 (-),score=119.58 TRINITY_DN9044_c0_g2_i1:106-1377(-)